MSSPTFADATVFLPEFFKGFIAAVSASTDFPSSITADPGNLCYANGELSMLEIGKLWNELYPTLQLAQAEWTWKDEYYRLSHFLFSLFTAVV
mmetsp:Transcript_15404/g.26031  ORF Transcript_15404/g.26031 Transcript_15404/m.26031 type:complete len:93 (+) Transcript_15404:12-290(+)